MADNFDPDAWTAKNGYAGWQAPGVIAAPPTEPTYEQKVAALQQRMAAMKTAKPQTAPLPDWLAAPVGAVSAALPGLPGVAGGIGAKLAGHTFGEGYKMGTQSQNNVLAKNPIAGMAGAIGGSVLSPVSKAVGGLSLPYRALAGGAMGAAQGAGMATNLDELKHNAGVGAATGIGSTLAAEGVSRALKSAGGYLGNARNRLVDYFADKGAEKITANPKLSVLGNDANAIGAPGPKSVPELQTSEWLRTPQEKELARTAARAVPILQRTRPESAIVQTMGPEFVGDVIGNKTSNALAHRAESEPLFKALNRIGKLGGADVGGEQLSKNIQRTMAAKQLGSQSPLSSLFESATGQDLGEAARRVANTADENLFYTPNAYDAGAKQMEKGANGYLERLGDNLANRHGGGYVPKPSVMAGKATVPAAPAGNNVATGVVDLSAPMAESAPAMQPHSSFLGAGQPSSKINYSQYSPSEAAAIGGAAERTNAINIGRNTGGTIADMMKKFGSNPITGAIPGLGGAARVMGAMGPGSAEVASGLVSKVGQGLKGTGNALSKYVPPEQVTAAFLAAHVPKEEEQQP